MRARPYELDVEVNSDDLIDVRVTDDIGQSSLVALTPRHARELARRLRDAVREHRQWARRRAELN